MLPLKEFLGQAWVGTTIGIVSIIAAVVVSIYFYRRSKVAGVLASQSDGEQLLAPNRENAPSGEIEVLFRGTKIPRLSVSELVIWNAGDTTIRGEDVVERDPFRIECGHDAHVLDVSIVATTRQVIDFSGSRDEAHVGHVLCSFDFLDPGDGVRVRILHTGVHVRAIVTGTIRGISEGCHDLGRIPAPEDNLAELLRRRRRRGLKPRWIHRIASVVVWLRPLLGWVAIVIGLSTAVAGLYWSSLYAAFPILQEPMPRDGPFWTFIVAGLIYALLPALVMWKRRLRFPRALQRDRQSVASEPPA